MNFTSPEEYLAEELGLDWEALYGNERWILELCARYVDDEKDSVYLQRENTVAQLARDLSTNAFHLARVRRVRDNIASTHPEVAEMLDQAMNGTWFSLADPENKETEK